MSGTTPDVDPETAITVEVAFATPARQVIVQLQVPPGTTVDEAIDLSGVRQQFAEIGSNPVVGIFSRKVALDYLLARGDRVEIYRPLLLDPKRSRREKVELERKEQQRTGKHGAGSKRHH